MKLNQEQAFYKQLGDTQVLLIAKYFQAEFDEISTQSF